MVVTFDLFGTLVEVDPPDAPASAVGAELRSRGVTVPDDWSAAYGEHHVDAPSGAEVPLTEHVRAALSSRGVDPEAVGPDVVREAVLAAFDPSVVTRDGARDAVAAAAECGPVGVLSDCSVRGLAHRVLVRSTNDERRFDAIVTSSDCGWRKPSPRAFRAAADALGGPVTELRHVGDDPETDGGAVDVGGTAILLGDLTLEDVATGLREERWE